MSITLPTSSQRYGIACRLTGNDQTKLCHYLGNLDIKRFGISVQTATTNLWHCMLDDGQIISVRFSSPREDGELSAADLLNIGVLGVYGNANLRRPKVRIRVIEGEP